MQLVSAAAVSPESKTVSVQLLGLAAVRTCHWLAACVSVVLASVKAEATSVGARATPVAPSAGETLAGVTGGC